MWHVPVFLASVVFLTPYIHLVSYHLIQFGKTSVDIARAKGYSEVLQALSSDQVSC